MDGNLAPGQIYGLFNYCQNKIGTPKGVVSKKKKKKGHLQIRSGFGVVHRPKDAKISASTQVLPFLFLFFGDLPFFSKCLQFDPKTIVITVILSYLNNTTVCQPLI